MTTAGSTDPAGSARARRERLLQVGLLTILAVVCLRVDVELVTGYPWAVDADIPLRAVDRWLDDRVVYDPGAFDFTGGRELPFLYPPLLLPLLAPLAVLPRTEVLLGWLAVTAAAGLFSARRLGLGWAPALVLLAWPPFLEAILGGNLQLLLFAAFVTLFFAPTRPSPWTVGLAPPIDLAHDRRPAAHAGVLATFVGAIKVSQLHAWFHLLGRRPRAAIVGFLAAAGVALATIPVVGVGLWLEWLGQAAQSGDPTWKPIGAPLSLFLGRPLAVAITAISVVVAVLVRSRNAGAWIGWLTVIGAPSLHIFGLLFVLPGLLAVRRTVGLVAAILIATTAPAAVWLGVALVGAGLWIGERPHGDSRR